MASVAENGSTVNGRWVILVDGDRVGDILDAAANNSSTVEYVALSRLIDTERSLLTERLRARGVDVVLAASDTILGLTPADVVLDDSLLATGLLSWSLGLGSSLKDAHSALAAAKANGRGRAMRVLQGGVEELGSLPRVDVCHTSSDSPAPTDVTREI